MTLCKRIKSICDEKGLSLYRVERDCGFGNGSIMKWENSSPKVENVIKLADYFDVSVDYLLDREIPTTKKAIPEVQLDDDMLTIQNIQLMLAENSGMDYIEKLYKELQEKQKMFVLAWLISYVASEGLPVKHILGK